MPSSRQLEMPAVGDADGAPTWVDTDGAAASRPGVLERASAFSQTRDQLSSQRRAAGGKIHRRYFVLLLPPPNGQSDLVWGSWWFIYGSILQALIPVPPLISLFLGFWEETSAFLPLDIHASMYALEVLVGIFFTVGSYAFLRAVHPELQWTPFFNPTNREVEGTLRKLCITDELWGMWCFFFGVLCGIPIFSFFVHFAGSASFGYWELILLVNIFVVLLVGFGVRIAWPSGTHDSDKQLLAPYFLYVFGGCKSIAVHLANDMLILSWGMYFSCILGLIGCLGLLALSVRHGQEREIYDYAANSVDMIFFLVGALYFTAGWYVVPPGADLEPLSPNSSSSPAASAAAAATWTTSGKSSSPESPGQRVGGNSPIVAVSGPDSRSGSPSASPAQEQRLSPGQTPSPPRPAEGTGSYSSRSTALEV